MAQQLEEGTGLAEDLVSAPRTYGGCLFHNRLQGVQSLWVRHYAAHFSIGR